ncbi:hypothetical protein JNK13_11140 [bacterium]|nr:hypothetical protein [bacterium]
MIKGSFGGKTGDLRRYTARYNMDLYDIITLASSIASIVISVLAIILSIYFYTQTKNSESNVTSALAEIKSQSESLQNLTGRWMDRLTNYATQDKTALLEKFISMQRLPEVNSIAQVPPQSDLDKTNKEQLAAGVLAYALISLYYAVYTNVLAASYLPKRSTFDADNQLHILIKRLLDGSAKDVAILKAAVDQLEKAFPQQYKECQALHLLDDVNHFISSVKPASDVLLGL